jgi:hypothetical protein
VIAAGRSAETDHHGNRLRGPGNQDLHRDQDLRQPSS